MSSDRVQRWFLLVLLGTIGCQTRQQDGLEKFPVTGTVLVDGEAADGVVVRFFRDGLPGKQNADTPLAVTGDDGSFALATNFDRDGAVAGTYKVTFTWKDSNAPGAYDRLKGQYTNLAQSQFEATIDGPTELPPFELTTKGENPASTSDANRKRRSPGLPPVEGAN